MAETFRCELDEHIAESMKDPEFRAAYEDSQARNAILDSLVALRKRSKLTQKDVAKRIGVKQSTVSGFETEGSDPRLATLQRYARAVDAQIVIGVVLDHPTEAYEKDPE